MTLECSTLYCLSTHHTRPLVTASELRTSAIKEGWIAIGPTLWELDWYCPKCIRFELAPRGEGMVAA
jgi:hypothetical protein